MKVRFVFLLSSIAAILFGAFAGGFYVAGIAGGNGVMETTVVRAYDTPGGAHTAVQSTTDVSSGGALSSDTAPDAQSIVGYVRQSITAGINAFLCLGATDENNPDRYTFLFAVPMR